MDVHNNDLQGYYDSYKNVIDNFYTRWRQEL